MIRPSSFIFLVLWTCLPAVSMVRMAVMIGNNIGLGDEKPLRYATRDAEQVEAVMSDLGGIDKGRGYLLLDPDVGKVLSIFQEVRNKIISLRSQGEQIQLLIYYSGHGSDDAMHMNGEKLPLSKIRSYFQGIEADLKILIADACFSGSLIQSKGATLADPVPVKYSDELKVNGSAILTSSSAGELSQESKELKGSLFTHYFLTAIRGAGDADRDGKVSLWEAYNYTQSNLRRRQATVNNSQQNPEFDMDLHGSENVVLTRMDLGQSLLTIKGVPEGRYQIMESVSALQIAEVNITDAEGVILALPRSPYLIYRSEGRLGLASFADLRNTKSMVLSGKDFSTMAIGDLSAKGFLAGAMVPPQVNPIRVALFPRIYSAFPARTGGAMSLSAALQGSYKSFGTTVELIYLPISREITQRQTMSLKGFGVAGELRYYHTAWRMGTAFIGPRMELWRLEQTVNQTYDNLGRMIGTFAIAGLEKRLAYRISLGVGLGAGYFWSYDQVSKLRRDPSFPFTFSLHYDL